MSNKEFETLFEQYKIAKESYNRNIYSDKADDRYGDLCYYENKIKGMINPCLDKIVHDSNAYYMRYIVRGITTELDINFYIYNEFIIEMVKGSNAYIVFVAKTGGSAVMKAPANIIGN